MAKITKKQRLARATGVAIAGFSVALAIMLTDNHLRTDMGFLRCATGGAFLSGLIFAGAFGHKGPLGWFYAGMGFGGATVLGAMFAVLLLPLDMAFANAGGIAGIGNLPQASLFGPAYVITMMLEKLSITSVWLVSLVAIHLVTQHAQAVPALKRP